MRVEEFRRALDKRSASRGLEVVFHPPASTEALQALSEWLGGPLPFQVGDTGDCVTLTMASFWSNKVFAWVDKRRPIWESRGAVPPCGAS